MTRETDSSSANPQGRGGAAYPSGTPPYGSRSFPSLHPQERAGAADAPEEGAGGQEQPAQAPPSPAEPRTETTLTTRIRINIPGSRPIPPVVMRTTVDEATAAAVTAPPPAAPEAPAEPAPETAAEPEPGKEKTSDWFAPRKPPAPTPPAPAGQPAPAPPAEPWRDAPTPVAGYGAGAPAPLEPLGGGQENAPAAYLPPPAGPQDTSAAGFSAPYADQAPPPPGAGSPFEPGSGQPGTGEAPFDTGSQPFGAGSPFDTGTQPQPPAGAEPPFGAGSPFDTGSQPFGAGGPFEPGTPQPGAGEAPFDTGSQPFGAGSPFDTGTQPPVTGEGQFDTGSQPFGAGGPFEPGTRQSGSGDAPFDTGSQPFGPDDFPPGVPRPSEQTFPGTAEQYGDGVDPLSIPYGAPAAPAGPTAGPATGDMRVPPQAPDATQPMAAVPAEQGLPPAGPQEGVSGDTLVGAVPAVPAGESRAPRPAPAPRPAAPEPAPAPAAAKPAAAHPARKGRSKLALLVVAAGGAVVVAYGAGLMMNHADVPKGTTVLGVDIGNQNQDAAVKTLDSALGNRTTAPLHLTVGGRKQTLKPSVAGLSVDTDATVRKVAHTDYNPVSVIGSLFGGSRKADPVIVVDEDKLKVALKSLAGSGGNGSDGLIRFSDGKAVAVPGKPRQSFDVDAAATQVAAAYRTRAETGADNPVALSVTTVPAKVSQAEFDKALNGFAKNAMSALVTVRADGLHTIQFGPNRSLPKFLTMVPDPDGKLVPHIDLKVLKSLYGSRFNGVLLERGNGKNTAVTPQDIATAMYPALAAPAGPGKDVTLPNVAH